MTISERSVRGGASLAVAISHAAALGSATFPATTPWGKRKAPLYPLNWTDERVEFLKKLWGDGLSASQIADRLGEVTRNAVIGKIHRLGLANGRRPRDLRASTSHRPRAAKNKLSPKAKNLTDFVVAKIKTRLRASREPSKLLIPVLTEAPEGSITMANLQPGMCKWPIGDPKQPGFHFCGGEKLFDVPYCVHHMVLAYNPLARKRRAA